MFRRPEFENALTAKLKAGNMPVVDLLCDLELSETVRRDSSHLINYLKRDNYQNLHEVIEFALTTKHNQKVDAKYKFYQVNRNASMLLATPGTAMRALLKEDQTCFEMMWRFVTDPEYESYAKDPVFAGHYTRLFEAFARLNRNEMTRFIQDPKKVVQFFIDNINCLAYSLLLGTIISDFDWFLDRNTVVKMTLNKAVHHALDIDEILRKLMVDTGYTTTQQQTEKQLCRSSEDMTQKLSEYQPLNAAGERFPVPHYRQSVPGERSFRTMRIRRSQQFKNVKTRIVEKYGYHAPDDSTKTEEALSDAQMKAYCLLMAIQEASHVDEEIYTSLQNEDAVESLFVCGVFSDENSMVSVQAFRLLNTVVHAIVRDAYSFRKLIEKGLILEYDADDYRLPIEKISDEEYVKKLTKEFAQCIEFSPVATLQIIAAFPMFWDAENVNQHLQTDWRDIEPVTVTWTPISVEEVQDPDLIPDQSKFDERTDVDIVYKCGRRAKTPLELYSFALLGDPELSDFLSQAIMSALQRFAESCSKIERQKALKEVRDGKLSWMEYQKRCFRQYTKFFDFVRVKFAIGDSKEVDLTDAPRFIQCRQWTGEKNPLPSQVTERARTTVNGFVYRFLEFWSEEMRLDDLGDDDDPSLGFIDFDGKPMLDNKKMVSYLEWKYWFESQPHKLCAKESPESVTIEKLNDEPALGEKSARERLDLSKS